MWPNFDGKPYTREALAAHIAGLDFSHWRRKDGRPGRPEFITLHNTADPSLRLYMSWPPAKRRQYIANVQHFYEHEKSPGWKAGPHFFVPPTLPDDPDVATFGFSDPGTAGTHCSCFNNDSIGIEMFGDFTTEPFDSGPGASVRDNAVYLMALLHHKLGLDPDTIRFHVECRADNHNCPGRLVRKPDIMARVRAAMEGLDGAPSKDPDTGPPAEPVPPVTPAGPPAAPARPDPSPQVRARMAAKIVSFEARRDSFGHLAVYRLPAGDGGGTYEVAGINDGFHPREAAALRSLVQSGQYAEAERRAGAFMLEYTDVVLGWLSGSAVQGDPGVEFFLRDTALNRGPGGAANVLQRALGVRHDGKVGPQTRGALRAAEPAKLLADLRAARERYEREEKGRGPGNKFWAGLVNRWNNALAFAQELDRA